MVEVVVVVAAAVAVAVAVAVVCDHIHNIFPVQFMCWSSFCKTSLQVLFELQRVRY